MSTHSHSQVLPCLDSETVLKPGFPSIFSICSLPPRWSLPGGRQVAVEAVSRVAVVLGHVDDPALRVDRAGLVDEPPHRLDGHRLHRRRGARRYLEDVAVLLLEPLIGPDGVLLSGQPRAPRGRAAVAVVVGPVEDERAPSQLARARVEVGDGDPALGHAVVGVAPAGRPPGMKALVVARDPDGVATALEVARAVVARRRGDAVRHPVTRPPEAHVVEPLRQGQRLARLALERPVAGLRERPLERRERLVVPGCGEQPVGHGEAGGRASHARSPVCESSRSSVSSFASVRVQGSVFTQLRPGAYWDFTSWKARTHSG